MEKKWKTVLLVIIIIVAFSLLAFVGTKLYVNSNYDIKIVTDSGTSFFIFETSFEKYYFVNSSIGLKTGTNKFDVKSNELSEAQIQQLIEIEKTDSRFTIEQYRRTPSFAFFYENYIFYRRYESGTDVSNEDWKDMQDNIYKFNIDTKQTEKIKKKTDITIDIDVELEALIYIYPKLEEAISSKCINEFGFVSVYYDKGRILFKTSLSTSARGTTEYLYEYMPANDKTRKITSTSATIVSVEIVK